MVSVGDPAPEFTAPLAKGDVTVFTLSDHLEAEAPVILAFFPGAFTSVCSAEMRRFGDSLAECPVEATLYGVSVDTPFALNAFRDDLGVDFGMISDSNRQVVEAFDVAMDFDHIGLDAVATRAVFVIDETGTVTWRWVAGDPGIEPDYEAVMDAVVETA